jgi:chemotaxis response regulator CheB
MSCRVNVANHAIVTIETSVGRVDALIFLAKGLPQKFPAPILVTIHLARQFRSSTMLTARWSDSRAPG